MRNRDFLEFREQCIWLRCCYNTYVKLFESGPETEQLLKNVAAIFFHDLNNILIDNIWLQICKLTDPAMSMGRKNLTVKHINNLLESSNLMNDEIITFSENIMKCRSLIKEGRNRLISHLDRESVLNDKPIGEHKKEDDILFFDSLQGYCDSVGIVIGVGPLDFSGTPGPGDVVDLLKKLKRAT